MKFEYAVGATPIDLNEAAGLIPESISLQHELDALEQANIFAARDWAFRRRHKEILTAHFAPNLHRRMFGRVWRWAGQYRRSNKNIGCEWSQVPLRLMQLCSDVAYWIEHETYDWDELGVRFHHQLVAIHPFSNGNGRHARLFADLLLFQNGRKPFSWGAGSLQAGNVRARYIEALQAADKSAFEKLKEFARSELLSASSES